MDNKELEEIVNKLSGEVGNLNNFRDEAKKNEEDLFGITKDVYNVLRNNKSSISSLSENINDLKDAQTLLQNQYKDAKLKNDLIQEGLNDLKNKQQNIEQNITRLNVSLDSFKNSINYRLNSFYTSLENKIISETRRQNLTSPASEQKFAPPPPMQGGGGGGRGGGGGGGGFSGGGSAAASAAGAGLSTAGALGAVAIGAVGAKAVEMAVNQAANPNPSAAPPSSTGSGPSSSIGISPQSPNSPVQNQNVTKLPSVAKIVGGIDRSKFQAELQNPETRQLFYQMMHAEVGSQGRSSQVAFAETVFNRAHATNRTLKSILSDTRYYEPYRNGGFAKAGSAIYSNPSLTEGYASVLSEVSAGSNTTDGATHNASGSVAASVRNGGYDAATSSIKTIGGETYYSKTFEQKALQNIPKIETKPEAAQSQVQTLSRTTAPSISSISPQEQKERPYRIQGQAVLPATSSFGESSYSAVTGGGGRGSMAYGNHALYEQQGGAGSVIRNYLRNINDPTGSKNVVFNVGSPGGVMADPKVGTRSEIQIHMGSTNDINKLVSSGCLAIPPNEYPKFIAHLKEMIKEKGSASLAIMPSAPGEPHKFQFLGPDDINKSKMQRISADEAVNNFRTTGDIDRKPQDIRLVASNDQAYKMVRDAAVRAGSTNPDLTASIAMMESGWLKKGIYARGTNNPFGQTGTGSKGFVVGADGQKHKAYGSLDEAVQDHLKRWGSHYQGDAQQTLNSLVKGGYNTVNPAWAPSILGTYNKQLGQAGQSATQTPAPSNISGGQKTDYPIPEVGDPRFNRISGDPREYAKNITQINTPFGKAKVSADAAEAYSGFFNDLNAAGAPISRLGSYNIRQKNSAGAGHSPGSGWSQHSYGNAIDIDDATHLSPAFQKWRQANPSKFEELKKKWGMLSPRGDEPHMEFGGKISQQAYDEIQKRLDETKQGAGAQQQGVGLPQQGLDKKDNRMAFSFSTEKPLDVAETIKKSGLKPEQNIIGVDVQRDERGQYKSPEHVKTMEEAQKAGAKIHLYHQGPGMKEFGENSKGWEDNLKKMLSENRGAYQVEVDNLDQFKTPDKQIQFIRSLQEWQKQNNLSQKLTLKNADPELMKRIGDTKDLDKGLLSQFQIQEQNTGKGTGGESPQEVAKRVEAGKKLNLTPVITGNTNQYEQREPVVSEGKGAAPGGEVKQPPTPDTAKGLTPPAEQNQKAPEETKAQPPPSYERGSSSNDYERAYNQSSAPQNSMGSAGASINPLAQTPGSHFALYGGGITI